MFLILNCHQQKESYESPRDLPKVEEKERKKERKKERTKTAAFRPKSPLVDLGGFK